MTDRIASNDVQEYESVQQTEESVEELPTVFRSPPRPQRRRKYFVSAAVVVLALLVGLCYRSKSQRKANSSRTSHSFIVTHDTSTGAPWNPFQEPAKPHFANSPSSTASSEAYWTQPHLVNGALVAIAEGDVYYGTLESMAVRVTKTTGNVRTPRLHPRRPLLAYTATYTGRREVYLLDLTNAMPSTAITCWEGDYGVKSIVGWKDDTTLVLAAYNREVGLEDVRLYELRVDTFIVTPVPLAQATEGVYDDSDCLYFTRFAQSSKTVRYVGGTAESLWKWCQGERHSTPLYPQYNGTSKTPSIYRDHLYFLSDRNHDGVATTMNLWAAPLNHLGQVRQITNVYCQFDGLALQEYSLDVTSGDVVLRIGASLYRLTAAQVGAALRDRDIAKPEVLKMPIVSDFSSMHEKMVPIELARHLTSADLMETPTGDVYAALTVRGQSIAAPIVPNMQKTSYQGAGQNMPLRRYRIAPSSQNAGSIRVLRTLSIPRSDGECMLLIADDGPYSEHAFYRVKCTPSDVNEFATMPTPFYNASLGSVWDVAISPCGRRMAWSNTDTKLFVINLGDVTDVQQVPRNNELDEPINAVTADFSFSPGGRYLSINHQAHNQFQVISIADLGEPSEGPITVGRIAQVTPSRFNSFSPYWGKTTQDDVLEAREELLAEFVGNEYTKKMSTTLHFLSDRDLTSDVESPFGPRAPQPHYIGLVNAYSLPLYDRSNDMLGLYSGGGVQEVFEKQILEAEKEIKAALAASGALPSPERRLRLKQAVQRAKDHRKMGESFSDAPSSAPTFDPPAVDATEDASTPRDASIDFGAADLSFARRAYRISGIPGGNYWGILSQTADAGALSILEKGEGGGLLLQVFAFDSYPSDLIQPIAWSEVVLAAGVSSDTKRLFFVLADGSFKVCSNSVIGMTALVADTDKEENFADLGSLAVNVVPAKEFQQMYGDAWRMLRDYFYDPSMHGIDWTGVHSRYVFLVSRCRKREDLDDVLAQMAAELSALHVFVYGGSYEMPLAGQAAVDIAHEPASLGADLVREPAWKGYRVVDVPVQDPDLNLIEDKPTYSPLSNQSLAPTGQQGLAVGDIIVGVDGESTLSVPDINMLLRGKIGRSVRLEVLRSPGSGSSTTESLLVVPLMQGAASELRYNAWKWKTRQRAKELAAQKGFTVGYVHMTDMDREGQDAFARDFFPDYPADALIIDVRHNHGGNIDSWIISLLQRKAWNFWSSRSGRIQDGDLDWNEHSAFRGHVVVLIDEKTSSDAEALSRGVLELGLGILIGKRTWGGGIWLSSDNHLVDGGIATAPELGTYDRQFGWGSGIEQMGVSPDIEVDKDPAQFYYGNDEQLARAVDELDRWLKTEPIVFPSPPGPKPNMAISEDTCSL